MSFELDEKNSSNSMIVKDILNQLPFNESEIKDDQKDQGGIPLSRVVDLEKQEKLLPVLKCKICLNILLNPYDCSKCGNTFCFSCINRLKESMKKCPFGCIDYEIMPSSFAIKKFLEQLKFICLNKDNGCNEIISYNNLEQHDKNCNYINATCPNNQCGIKIKWNLLDNHIQKECLYTLFECSKCHLKLNRKEYLEHNKICRILNRELDKQSPIINKLTKEDFKKNNEIFNNVMNSIENLPSFSNENNDNNNINNNNNSYLNILIKTLIFTLSGKISKLENQMNKINASLQQFSENNLVFYQSINDELESINEKISNINLNESITDNNKMSIKNSINKINNTYNNENFEFSSPIVENNKKKYVKDVFTKTSRNINININENKEREKSIKGYDKNKTSYNKELLSTSKNKKKLNNKYELSDNNININEAKDKNKNISKKSITINTLKTKEKFIKEMKSTKYIEKLKGIHPKKTFNIFNYNLRDKSAIENININSNIIKEQSNNYLISNNFNTINTTDYKRHSKIKKNFSKNIRHKNTNLKDKIKKDEDNNNENVFDYIFSNQEIILDKIQNLENVMINARNYPKDNNSNNEFLSPFNSHKQSFDGMNNNSINLRSESPKFNIKKNNN